MPTAADRQGPGHEYAGWRARGVHQRAGSWVVARPGDVASALQASSLVVPPPPSSGGPADSLRSRMARFCDGADHPRRRALAVELLPDPATLGSVAAGSVQAALASAAPPYDVMPVARRVPAEVLAITLGVPSAAVTTVIGHVATLCAAWAPWLGDAPTHGDADAAARALEVVVGPIVGAADERVAALVGLLVQAQDATAGLIGAALLAGGVPDPPPEAVAPVQGTRRVAVTDTVLGGVALPRGADVWVVLAGQTFGAGRHACPGRAAALALARGLVAAVHAAGWRAVPRQPVAYEPRANLRVPARVMLEWA